MTDFRALIGALVDAGIDFILVGGTAAIAHGSARSTYDIDIVYARNPENLSRVVAALTPHAPYPRGAPPGLPFHWDASTLKAGLNFTLTTKLGDLDLLGEVTGGGRFEDLVPHSLDITIAGRTCRCLDLPKLIEIKRAAGRPKDFEAIAELEVLLEERNRLEGSS